MNRLLLRLPLLRRLVVGLALLAACAVEPGVYRAQPPTPPAWAGEWLIIEDGQAEGTVSGLEVAPAGGALQPADAGSPGVLLSPVRDMGHAFLAVGVLWRGELSADALALEVRVSQDGQTWGEWQTFLPLEAAGPNGAPESQATDLVFARGRYVQLRASVLDMNVAAQQAPPLLEELKLVAIDPGASSTPLQAKAASGPSIISRAGWGANESYMTWEPEYRTVTHFVVHHTATPNSTAESDPYGVVRSVYYYHAVTLGWGDIGYNYLVDRQGRIYEGRYGGDGVVAGHARPYNYGTVGVSILGDYSYDDVPQTALDGLVELLAWKCNLHFVHPLQSSFVYDGTFPNVMAHRDCNPTTCPGDRAYARMPWVRSATWERMRNIPPRLILNRPTANEQVSGIFNVTWRASAAASQATIAVDGTTRVTVPAGAGVAAWNTATSADGTHTLRLTVATDLGQSAYVEVPVRILNNADHDPPAGSFTAPALTRDQTVTLNLTCQGCDRVQFGNGWQWEGENLQHQSGRLVTDSAAANGRAWRGMVVVDSSGLWYGPSYCGLNAGNYEAQFWLRADPLNPSATVADLDVADTGGARTLGGPRVVVGSEFTSTSAYHLFRVPFSYPGAGSTCQGSGNDGVDLRTRFKSTCDMWLDRVAILTAPQPFATQADFTLPAQDGQHLVEVRYVDAAGNVSPTYTRTVTLDRTAPRWGQPSAAGVPVSDSLAGMAAAAYYATSEDGTSWGTWVPVMVQLAADGLSGSIPAQVAWQGQAVRLKARDAAGNEGISPPLLWPRPGIPIQRMGGWKAWGGRPTGPTWVACALSVSSRGKMVG